jgi:CIC family chloride channel protein
VSDKKFKQEALWSSKEFKRWESQALNFFKLWAPLLLVSGVAGGLGAVLFRLLIILNQVFFFGLLGGHGVPLIFLPVIGGIIVGPVIYLWAREAWGHGVPEVMEALDSRGGKIRARVAAVKILASSITIGSGGSAGREGPIAQIGAAVSSVVGQLLHLDERSLKLMLMAGASAGISGTFKAPIGGALFGLEVLNRKMRTTDLVVMVFSSIVGYVVSVAILGPAPILMIEGVSFKILDIPFYLLLGIIGGLASYIWTRSLYGVDDLFARLRIGEKWFSPFLGAWVVGG